MKKKSSTTKLVGDMLEEEDVGKLQKVRIGRRARGMARGRETDLALAAAEIFE